MLKILATGILARVLGMGLLFGGFWLLFKGFLDPSVPLGILGGAMIPVGMWAIAQARGAPRANDGQ